MTILKEHQKEGLSFLKNRKGAGLFFEMRCGKTLTTLEHLNSLHRENITPTLIVAPKSVCSVWQDEIKKHGYSFESVIIKGDRKQKIQIINEPHDFYIINYEGVRVLFDYLIKKGFKTIILDESHRAKSIKSKQTQCILKLGDKAQYKYILSGTPITKSPEDIWSQIHFIQPGYLSNFFSFKNKYVEYKKIKVKSKTGPREISIPYRFKHLKELESILSEVILRKTQAECFDMPAKSYQNLYAEMEGDQLKAYLQMKYSYMAAHAEGMSLVDARTQLTKILQICGGFIYDKKGVPTYYESNAKLDILNDLLVDLENEKVIVLCTFDAEKELLKKSLPQDKLIVFEGDDEERFNARVRFQESKEPCILLSTAELVKEGVDLSSSNCIVFYSRNFKYETRYQAEARIQHPEKRSPLMYYDIICPMTADERVLDVLKLKEETADKILGDSERIQKLILGE